jgi:hypothetical protein
VQERGEWRPQAERTLDGRQCGVPDRRIAQWDAAVAKDNVLDVDRCALLRLQVVKQIPGRVQHDTERALPD